VDKDTSKVNRYARIPRKRKTPRRKRPELTRRPVQERKFLDSRSYVTKGGRVRLFGADYTALQIEVHQRAKGVCECGCGQPAPWAVLTDDYIPLEDKGEVSHNEHGARKSDEPNRVKWMRHECHMKSHNCGGKPVPRKERANAN